MVINGLDTSTTRTTTTTTMTIDVHDGVEEDDSDAGNNNRLGTAIMDALMIRLPESYKADLQLPDCSHAPNSL